jgi:hypothetical protein
MAFEITGPFTFTGVVDGRPVFAYRKRFPTSGKTAPAARRGAPNKFPGDCADCGARVEKDKGIRFKDGDAWRVAHNPGQCAPKAAEQAAPAPVAAAPAAPKTAPAPRPGPENRFPGSCSYCGQSVEAGKGICFKDSSGWKVAHRVCPEGATVLETAVEQPMNRPINVPGGQIELGIFTVVHQDNSWTTIRVYRPDEAKRVKLAYLFGRDNDFAGAYKDFASVGVRGQVSLVWLDDAYAGNERLRRAVAAVVGDPEAAGKAYAVRSTRCWKCNRTLTTPQSIEDGIGPDCKAKRGA